MGPSIAAGECLLRRLHLQCVIKSIEIIKQPDRREQLDNFAFIKMLAQLAPELVVNGMRVFGDAFRQPQGGFIFVREIRALFEGSQIVDLIVSPAVPSCQDGV